MGPTRRAGLITGGLIRATPPDLPPALVTVLMRRGRGQKRYSFTSPRRSPERGQGRGTTGGTMNGAIPWRTVALYRASSL